LNLDVEKFRELLREGSPADVKVRRDIALGITLGLNATPQIFFEGKKLPAEAKSARLVRVMEELVRADHPEKRDFRLRKPFM
jgi:protein-disulfide isomerase